MQKWMRIAESRMGVKEIKGPVDNLQIVGYFADVGHEWVKDDETAWCAAFVGSCLENAGVRSTRELNARSYLRWGVEIAEPVVGCVVVFWRESRDSWKGHTGFVVEVLPEHIIVRGGNQNNEVNETKYPKNKVLGYRMPKTAMSSKTNWAAGVGGVGAIVSQVDGIGKVVDDVAEVVNTGGDMADRIGGVVNSIPWPLLVFGAVFCLFGFIIYEREKKRREHGL